VVSQSELTRYLELSAGSVELKTLIDRLKGAIDKMEDVETGNLGLRVIKNGGTSRSWKDVMTVIATRHPEITQNEIDLVATAKAKPTTSYEVEIYPAINGNCKDYQDKTTVVGALNKQ